MRMILLMISLLFAMMVGSSVPQFESEIYILGPSGGTGGTGFTDEAVPIYDVYFLDIWTGSVVNGIFIQWGETGHGEKGNGHGKLEGIKHRFYLQQGEYITGISGRYGTFVDSIIIQTNLGRVSSSYGGPGGSAEYIYEVPSGWEIAGFCGRQGDVIDAIGVVLRKHS